MGFAAGVEKCGKMRVIQMCKDVQHLSVNAFHYAREVCWELMTCGPE